MPTTIKYKPLPELTDAERLKFWSKVAASASTECWPWVGGLFAKGYGCFPVQRKSYYAHRYALALRSGLDPIGLVVCHRCDNPRCCNPAHLFAGTHGDNMQDMLAKGRGPTAEARWAGRVEWRAERQAIRLEKKRVRSIEVAEKVRQANLFFSTTSAQAVVGDGTSMISNPAAVALQALRKTKTGGRNGGPPLQRHQRRRNVANPRLMRGVGEPGADM